MFPFILNLLNIFKYHEKNQLPSINNNEDIPLFVKMW